MSLTPRFYLGPIDVATDENSQMTVIWHNQLMQRRFYLSKPTVAQHATSPEHLLAVEPSDLQREDFPLHILQSPELGQNTPLTIDPVANLLVARFTAQTPGGLGPSHRIVSVAECLGFSW